MAHRPIYGKRDVLGRKGGGGKGGGGGSGSTPVEDPDSLRSRSSARIIEVISEGEIEGLVDGNKSIFLNDTPLENDDGSENFSGITIETRYGTPNQEYIPGFPYIESETNVGVQITKVLSVSRTITNANVNAVRVKIRVPQLTDLEEASGNLHGSEVSLAFDTKTDSGSFIEQTTITISGKSSGPYERSVRLELAAGGNPWTFRIRRITDDSASSTLSDDTYLSSYTEIIDAKMRYPDSAIIGIVVDAEQFGSQIASRAYEIKGIKSPIPSNYDPVARTYTGLWDGTFTTAWHSNPAWVLWDLITNTRYGLGDVIPAETVDKYGLYTIGEYCDGMVDDGLGGTEPRFAFNGVIHSREEAARVLDAVASVFRGMMYWGAGSVTAVQDSPKTPIRLVSRANVIDGEFNYTGTSLKSRHSVIVVQYNDTSDLSRRNFEVVRDDGLIAKYGVREDSVVAFGCTSRGQARRYGKWILQTEQYEGETVTYRTGLDHANVRPGQLVSIADPSYAGVRFGGRVVSATTTEVTIDDEIELESAETYTLAVVLDDQTVESQTVTTSSGTGISDLTVGSAFASAPEAGAMWVLTGSNVAPRTFRVISNMEKESNLYEITAMLYDDDKFDRVEEDIAVDDISYSTYPTGALGVPTDLTLTEYFLVSGTAVQPAVNISWTTPNDPRAMFYEVQVKGVNDVAWRPIPTNSALNREDYPTEVGSYQFRVRSASPFVTSSAWVTSSEYQLVGMNASIDDVTNFAIVTSGTTSTLSWAAIAQAHLDHYEIRFNAATTGVTWDTASTLLSGVPKDSTSAVVQSRVGTYLIKAVSLTDRESPNATMVTSEIAGLENVNVVATFTEHSAWAGTHSNTRELDGKLVLTTQSDTVMSDWVPLNTARPLGGSFNGSGTYEAVNSLSFGAVYRVYVSAALVASVQEYANVMSSWGVLSSVVPLASVGAGQWSVTIEVRTTDDDPSGSPTWSPWEEFQTGYYQHWGLEFRLVLTTTLSSATPEVSEFTITADVEDRVAGDANVACPVNGTGVTFSPAFMAVPAIAIDGQGMATGDYYERTNETETGFDIEFFNSSATSISRTFDWIAKGYGNQQ